MCGRDEQTEQAWEGIFSQYSFFIEHKNLLITYYRIKYSIKLVHHSLLELILSALSRQVKSKTVAQCVEYYYTWKKIMRLGRKHRTRLAEVIEDGVVSGATKSVPMLAPLPPHPAG